MGYAVNYLMRGVGLFVSRLSSELLVLLLRDTLYDAPCTIPEISLSIHPEPLT